MKKIGFIGCGNMGGALAAAAVKKIGADNTYVYDADSEKTKAFFEKYGAKVATLSEVCGECDYIFFGVKPQVLKTAFNEAREYLSARKDRFVIVSMAAGTPISVIESMAPANAPIIRIMPNMPVSVGEGLILFTPNKYVSENEITDFCTALSEAGEVDSIDESKIDAASCVSGCGPAFAFMFIEALSDGAVKCGLPRDKAILYAARTLAGSAEMVIKSGEHPGKLKDAVCSPAGSTIEGVAALENGSFRADAIEAVVASYKRTLELGK